MQVSVEESGAIERKLTISIPSDEIQSEVSKRLKGVARQAKIPGFRPGKAPQSVIRKRYEPQVTNEVISETINSSYMDALGQEKIVPAGLVSIDPTPYEPGEDFKYVATVELFPKIPNTSLEGKTITRPVVEVTDEDIDRTLEDIRTRNAEYIDSDGAADEGDKLTIDFVGTIDGEEFSGGNAEDFQFLVGKGQMLEEFDSGLRGASKGEEKTIAFTFPEDYGNADIAGKDVEFKVTVKAVEKPELPALDDSFAETLGIAEGGLDKMRTEIKNNLNRELANRMRTTMRDRVMDELYAINEIEIPKALVEEEIDRAVKQMTQQLESQGLPADSIDRNIYNDEASKRVALGLIARDIVENHEIKPDEDTIKAKITEMAESYEDPDAFVNWHMADPERRREFEAVVIEEQIVAKMLETATVNDEKTSFQDFMNPQPAS